MRKPSYRWSMTNSVTLCILSRAREQAVSGLFQQAHSCLQLDNRPDETRAGPCCTRPAQTVLSLVDDKRGSKPTRGRVRASAGRKPAGTTRYFPLERLWVDIHLHLPIFQMTVGHHGE